jgi:hypothetical protein
VYDSSGAHQTDASSNGGFASTMTGSATTAAKDAAAANLSAAHAATVASKDAVVGDLRTALATRERELATLRGRTAAQLAAVHAAITSNLALELHPVRRDRCQFATLHNGPVPFDEFDRAWCAAACGGEWKVDVDPVTHMRAHVARHSRLGALTLRGAAPLPRRLPSTGALPPQLASAQQLASYRVVVEAYPVPVAGKETRWCNVGFVPSHMSCDGALVTPVVGHNIHHYGGWWFQVGPAVTSAIDACVTVNGWKPLAPRAAATAGDVAAGNTSAYATTSKVPPVPAGSAVELAMDYAAGTCRVAFYTPAAVAGGFVAAPHAKMELRFVATPAEVLSAWGTVPARSVPTAAADSRMQLYPAVASAYAGAACRFV